MTAAGPPDAEQSRSSTAGARLLELAAAVLTEWERRARREFPAAADVPPLILRDYLLGYIQHAAALLDARQGAAPPPEPAGYLESAAVHGRLRATLPGYDGEQVVGEYALLRRVMDRQLSPTAEQRELLVRLAEQHAAAAAGAFTAAQAGARDEMVQNVEHALRSPLAAVLLALQLAERQHGQGRAPADQLARARRVAERLEARTEQVLATAQARSDLSLELGFERFDLRQLVRHIYDNARLALERPVELRLPPEPVDGCYSYAGCERALENLLDFVLCQQPSGGLRVELEAEPGLARVVIAAAEPGGPQHRELALRRLNGEEADPAYAWSTGLELVGAVARAHRGQAGLSTDGGRLVCRLELSRRIDADYRLIISSRSGG